MRSIFVAFVFILLFSCGSIKTIREQESIKIENKDLKEVEINKSIESVVLSILEKYTVAIVETNDSITTAPDGTETKHGNKKKTDLTGEKKTDQKTDASTDSEKTKEDKGDVFDQSKDLDKTDIDRGGFFKTIGLVVFFGLIVGIVLVVLFYIIKKK